MGNRERSIFIPFFWKGKSLSIQNFLQMLFMEAYLALFEKEERTEEMEKAFQYGVEALLESGEELL